MIAITGLDDRNQTESMIAIHRNAHVSTEDLAGLEPWPDGSAFALEDRDIHISVNGLLTAVLPAMLPAPSVAALFASRGGKATSSAKRSSAQANGRKGGRPRKAGCNEAA